MISRSRTQLTASFLRYRLQFYFTETGRALRKHWQLLVLVVGALSSIIDFRWVVNPVLSMAVARPTLMAVSVIGLYHLSGLVWITMQRRLVRGGAFAEYLYSLPLSRLQHRLVDGAVVAVADNALWVYLALVLVKAPYGAMGLVDALNVVVLTITLGTCLVGSQLVWLRDRLAGVGLVAIIDSLIYVTQAYAVGVYRLLGSVAVGGIALVLALGVRHRGYRIPLCGVRKGSKALARLGYGKIALIPPAARIQMRVVFGERWHETMVRLALGLASLAFASAIVVYGHRTDIAPSVLLVGDVPMVLVLSGLYRRLSAAHVKAGSFTASLPMSRHYWVSRDIFFVTALSACLIGPFLMALLFLSGLKWRAALLVFGSTIALTGLFRVVAAYRGAHTVIVSAIIACAWTLGAILVVHQF